VTINSVVPGAKQKIEMRQKKEKQEQVQRQGEKWKGVGATAGDSRKIYRTGPNG
jgi:hypothetical protein